MAPASPPRASLIRIGNRKYVLLSFERDLDRPKLGLTPAEREVAAALLAGLANQEIARLRGTSPRTVANQVANLFRKLGVQSRAELVARFGALLSEPGERR